MSEQKTRPGEATPGRAEAGQTACGGASLPIANSITIRKSCQGIAALLSPGKANGRKCAELAATVGTDGRSLRRAIQVERQAGALILSSTETGYFLPDNVDELREFVISMRHRAKEINSVCRAAENALADATGQTVIEGW